MITNTRKCQDPVCAVAYRPVVHDMSPNPSFWFVLFGGSFSQGGASGGTLPPGLTEEEAAELELELTKVLHVLNHVLHTSADPYIFPVTDTDKTFTARFWVM